MEGISNTQSVYHPRMPYDSPLWRLLNNHYENFERCYEERFEQKYGFFRPVIGEVVRNYLTCGDLKNGFARVRCGDCCKEYLLAFSCKGRWFCPSCHAKKVVQFGDALHETILYPVPHRHYVFSIPIMLRIYFKHDRALLTKLCQCAYHSLLIFLQNVIGFQDGAPGVVLSIHTFGDYPEKFHPHIHAIVSDGLFLKTGAFYVMPDVDLNPLEEIFRAKVFNMLKEEGEIDDDIIKKLTNWRHSGFSVHNKARIARDDEKGRVALAQYIIRNSFSLEKLTYNQEAGTVIYRSKMSQGKSRKNFQIYTAEEFIAAITQHIPEKSFQMVRYYGWYSNKSRGLREKQGNLIPDGQPLDETDEAIEIIDVSEYKPRRIPSKQWRDCIKKIYEADPLCCPKCGGEMKIISFITDQQVIRQILKHLGLWTRTSSRDPPSTNFSTKDHEPVYEFFDDLSAFNEQADGWPGYDESCTAQN